MDPYQSLIQNPDVIKYLQDRYAKTRGKKLDQTLPGAQIGMITPDTSSAVLPAKSKTPLLDQALRIGGTGMVTPDTSSNEANYQRIMNVAKGNVPLDTQQQFPEYFDYYGGQPISSMGDRAVTKEEKAPVKKSIQMSDYEQFAKTLGITPQELESLDAMKVTNRQGYNAYINALTKDKDLSAFMDKQKPSPVIPTQEAGKKETMPPATKQADITVAPTTAGTAPKEEQPVNPQDDYNNRMATTAVGNIFASLGAGLAGYSPTSVNQMFQGLYQQLGQKQREKEMRDPNSQMSKNYRELMAPYLPKGLDISNKSMFDLQTTMPALSAQVDRDYKSAMLEKELASRERIAARENASKERQASMIYGIRNDRMQQQREDRAFRDLQKSAGEIYNVTEAKALLKDIQEMKKITDKRSPMSLTGGRVVGALGVGGDPFGLQDADVMRLNTVREGMINKLVKDSGESGALSKADKEGFINNFPAPNSGNLREYLTAIENRILETRNDRMKKFNKNIQATNKQYGTQYMPEDFFDLNSTEESDLGKSVDKPVFKR